MSMVISGDSGLTFPAGSTQVQAGNYQTMVNRIINGRMEIDQRNAGASVTPANDAYTLDRWQVNISDNSKFTIQQNAGSVTPPSGFTNYLGVTSTSAFSLAAGSYFVLDQKIEGLNCTDLAWGTANAKAVTLSFWVRSSLTGTFGGVLRNSAENRSYPFTYTISAANTWEQKSINVAGDTSGTWLTTSGVGIYVGFGLGVGSTYSGTAGAWAGSTFASATGATSVVSTNGATWYVTGVDLRVGSYTVVPQDFRAYGTELALCQRYYEKSYNIDVAPATNTSAGFYDLSGSSDSGGNLIVRVSCAVSKRANPTVTLYTSTGSTGSWNYNRNGASGTGAGTVDNIGMSRFRVYIAIGANWVVGGVGGHWVASSEL